MNPLVWLVLLGLITAFTLSSILSALDSGKESISGHDVGKQRTYRTPLEWPKMNGQFQNIFWLVQLSDIHISIHHDPSRSSDLLRFCSEYLSIIDPEIVIVTGDLTDAKNSQGRATYQIKEEWETYKKVTSQCKRLTRAQWLDIRGNHDSFNVVTQDSEDNLFRSHSVMENALIEQVRKNSGYHYKLNLPFGKYSFIGFDAALKPGPKLPWNFCGTLDEKQIHYIKRMAAESEQSNHTVWFSHFPTSLIVHDPPVLRDIMSKGIAYLCGHLHQLGDFVPKMYSRQKTGMLELELGDWKFSRKFRIMAFDHDMMAVTDEFLGDWPVILVTNPKDSQFYSIQNEPVEMVKYSTHIRLLIFNHTPIVSAEVKIDKVFIGTAEHVKGPLYACKWNPLDYVQGLHTIEINVKDQTGNQKIVSHSFSVDGSSEPFRLISRLILMPNLFSVFKILFGAMVFLYTLVLTSLRQCEHIRSYYIYGFPVFGGIFNALITKVWLASRTKFSYIILIGSVLYLTFGPWFVDEVVSGHMGVIFVWGIIFNGTFIDGGITYFHGTYQFLAFNLPLVFVLGHVLDMKHRYGTNIRGIRYLATFFPVALLFAFSFLSLVHDFPRAYAFRSVYLGPLRAGNVVIVPLAVYLAFTRGGKTKVCANGVH